MEIRPLFHEKRMDTYKVHDRILLYGSPLRRGRKEKMEFGMRPPETSLL